MLGVFMNLELLFENMKYIREENDLSQDDIAKILNVTQSNYSRWENKSKIIPLKKLNELCNYYGISMDYIVGLNKNRKKLNKNYTLDNKEIGKNIKMIRIKNKINQKELATLLNTTQSVISNYEKGNTLILTSFAIQICLTYKISLDAICNRL